MLPPTKNSWIQEWLSAKCHQMGTELETVRYQDCGMMPFSQFAVWHPIEGAPSEAPLLRFNTAPKLQALWIDQELIGYLLEAEDTTQAFTGIDDMSTDTDRFFLVHPDQFEPIHDWFSKDQNFEQLGGEQLVDHIENEDGLRMVVIGSYDGNALIYAAPIGDDLIAAALIET